MNHHIQDKNISILAKNIIFLQETEKLISIFNKEEIDIMLIKGIAFLEIGYSDLSKRPLEDIDLLILPETLPKVKEILYKNGYKLLSTGEWTFYKENPFIILDIHTDIFYLTPKEFRKLWKNSPYYVVLDKYKTKIMNPIDSIIYSIFHQLIHHGFLRDYWIEDIYNIIQKHKSPDFFKKLEEKIKEYRFSSFFYIFFSKLNRIYPGIIPLDFISSLKSSTFLHKCLLKTKTYNVGHILRFLSLRWGRKIKFMYDTLFPTLDFLKRRYPAFAWLGLFLIFLRPFFLIIEIFKLSLQALIKI